MSRRWVVGGLLLAAAAVTAFAVVAGGQWSAAPTGSGGTSSHGGRFPTLAPQGRGVESCVAPPGAGQQDVDDEDSAEYPWARPSGAPATVFFETDGIPARYRSFVEQGAASWSGGPCVRAVAVARCPPGGGCTTVRVQPGRGDDGDTDGESEGTENGDVRVGDTITLYPDLLDDESDNGALATVTHEMGHALGLRHRDEPGVLMNAETDDDTESAPDAVDFANLVVIYGSDRSG